MQNKSSKETVGEAYELSEVKSTKPIVQYNKNNITKFFDKAFPFKLDYNSQQ